MPLMWRLLLTCLSMGLSTCVLAEARLAIIIDDIGYNQIQSERAAKLKGAITLSILPLTPHAITSARLAHSHGKELMLHLPMSTINNLPLGKGGLSSGMEKAAFVKIVQQNINSIPYIKGVNNHMGSRLTQEVEPMQWLMAELKPRGLYFVDSRTSAQTKAYDLAIAHQVPSLKRDVFLDDVNERSAIEFQLNRAIHIARERGSAVAIGHPYSNTLSILESMQPLLKRQQVTLVYVSQLLKPTLIAPAKKVVPPFLNHATDMPFCAAPPEPSVFNITISVDLYDRVGIIDSRNSGY